MRQWLAAACCVLGLSTLAQGYEVQDLGTFRCGFGERAQALRETFRQHGEAAAVAADARPPVSHAVASVDLPLVVHYEDAVTDDYARLILAHAEATWRTLFVDKGFLPPHPDGDLGGDARFDVYVVTTLPAGVGGYAGFSGHYEATPRADAFGYLVIANELNPRLRRFVVAHEMFHASQIAYDWWEDLAFMEGSATWVADQVFDDEDIYWKYFPFFNAEPYKALDYISMMSPYQYGMGLFSLFLDERYGRGDGLFLRSVWERSVQDDIDNEPDFLDATASLLAGGGGIDQAMREFGVWRLLVGSRKAYGKFSEVALWDNTMDPSFEADMPAGVQSASGRPVNLLQPLSHAFLRFPRPSTDQGDYDLALTGEGPTRFAVDVVALDGTTATVVAGGVVGAGETTHLTLPHSVGLQEFVYVVTNLAEIGHDADTSPWTGQPFRYDFVWRPQ